MFKFPFCLFFKIFTCISFILPQEVSASLLYDNGQGTQLGGSAIGHFLAADDFVLGTDANLTSASVDILERHHSVDGLWDGTVKWWILYDNGGEPGVVKASGTGQNISPSTPVFPPYFTVDFEFGQEVSVERYKTYWLVLHFQSDFDRVSVFWEFSSFTNNNISYSGGELVNGAPDFNGMYGGPGVYDKAFRLYGDKDEWGAPWIRTRPHRLSGVLAKYCEVEYSYTELPKLVCDFPWALTAELDTESESGEPHPPGPPFYSRDYHAESDMNFRSDLYWELHNLVRTGGNEKIVQKRLNLMADILETVPAASYFVQSMKISILKNLRNSRVLDFKIIRELMESINAIELDLRIPPIKTEEIKAGAYASTDLNGIVWLASRDLKKTGYVTLDIKDRIKLP